MKITKTELKKIIKEELLKEFGSEEYGLQTKEFEPIPTLFASAPDAPLPALGVVGLLTPVKYL